MHSIMELVRAEPVALQAIIQTGLSMGMAFGLGWTAEQVAMVLAFTQTILAFLTRRAVTANPNVLRARVEVPGADDVHVTAPTPIKK